MRYLENIDIREDEITEFCRRYPIRKLSLFGSVLRSDFNQVSDVDMLVEFQADARIDLFDMADMEIELTELLGRKVDLRTPEDLSHYFRQQVMTTAQPLYEQK